MIWYKIKYAMLLSVAGVLSLGACSDASSSPTMSFGEPLLANQLIYEDVSADKDLSYTLDPWLAKYPTIAKEIRAQKLAALSSAECVANQTCSLAIHVDLKYRGERLVSMLETESSFFGGAHPTMKAADLTYDVMTGNRLRFGDVFTYWPAARELIQGSWCDAVKDRSNCPAVEDQALVLSGGSRGIDAIVIQTSDYAFGSYAEGPADAYIAITPELIALAKPEYQPYFTLETCC